MIETTMLGPNEKSKVNQSIQVPNGSSSQPLRGGGGLACMINSEICAVLAVMRRNVRWGVQYMADDDHLEHPLIFSLKELRRMIFSWRNQWDNISPLLFLQPFLDVIQSDETGAPITGVALSSIYKILIIDFLDINTLKVDEALSKIIDTVTSCRFEVTDPASEEVVLMKILQVLLACMKSKASSKLSDQNVCNIVNTCFRVVHQASSKGELLQRTARHTMHELVRCIFSNLPCIEIGEDELSDVGRSHGHEAHQQDGYAAGGDLLGNGYVILGRGGELPSDEFTSNGSNDELGNRTAKCTSEMGQDNEASQVTCPVTVEAYGVPCMVEIFHFLCSLLNVVASIGFGPQSNPIAYDEDVPLFALGLINSAIELGGSSFGRHPKLLALIQDELFLNLMQFGLSMSPLILSTVCSIVLNLYYHLRKELKLQLEDFFSCVLLKILQSKHGASYHLQEVAMETLVDLCRHPYFIAEMYSNFDCNISSTNLFEDIVNLLSKSAFPVNGPLSSIHILAFNGLISIIRDMNGRLTNESPIPEKISSDIREYKSFWTVACENYDDIDHLVPYLRNMKYIKRRLMIGADHFNRDPKNGLEFLQAVHLLPDKLDPISVACFFRYTSGLDKNLVGDFLGNHDDFSIQVLHEFARTFDFRDMQLDIALRVFLETFRLPGESQKIQRVLEAFAERYYEHAQNILANKDAALLLSYSLILLNTDQHNSQVKKKMTEEDFIRNNRRINGGNDLPRDYLSELYHSICQNEIKLILEQGSSGSLPVTTRSNSFGLIYKSKQTAPFISCDSLSRLDYDMFTILSGPTIAAISVVFDQAEHEHVLKTCVEGFLDVAKIAACYHLEEVLDDLVISICKFTNHLHSLSPEELILSFAKEDTKARMATVAVFTIANRYGDYLRTSWKNILDCILILHRLGFLSTRLLNDAVDDMDSSSSSSLSVPPRKSSGLMGRFSQLLYLDKEEPSPQPSEEELATHRSIIKVIQECHIDSIFAESKFLQSESLLQLAQALIFAASRRRKGDNNLLEDESDAVFCLELLITVTLNNRDRIMLLWQCVYEHIANIVQSTSLPCPLVEKAVLGLLKICHRLLPYKEDLTDELLKSLQLVLKLDARVADAYCEQITQEVLHLVKANAIQIKSNVGWRTITSLVSITARHPEASEPGFETLAFIMSDGAHLSPANYILCINAARQFAESRVGNVDRSVRSLDLMGGSVFCLAKWCGASSDDEEGLGIGEMWLRLVQGVRKVCLDQREEVRNHAILMLQMSLIGADGIRLSGEVWWMCFDLVIFKLLDDLLEIAEEHSPKDYRDMETSLSLSVKLMSKVLLRFLEDLWQLKSFANLWTGVLNRMEKLMKMKLRGKKKGENLQELVREVLKNILVEMKSSGILASPMAADTKGGDESLWQLTWLHMKKIDPVLQEQVFSGNELEQLKHMKTGSSLVTKDHLLVASGETTTA
ncbi:ARF guanine-nucleotide exchange factor GNOM-like [Impatiens glandulifera]|uniref:ARF guanine-nucleotide exchange factor GNOM-like n=1 Tax=Impatiens glandulifera TaxID=253017 RepID=UPI001FB15F42|nr:ARF guanine-nucleotide exchange factor GNOM-like [Impatiens glandulifera]